MGFFDNESKQHRSKLVQLQNIILEIDENKLQVSEEFLDKMTKIYISRYMKIVNENIATINKVTNIGLLFKKYDCAVKNIDKLIKIEPFYHFRYPTPSEYKEELAEKLDRFVMSLISREWRKIAPQNPSESADPIFERKWKYFFETFGPVYDRLSESEKNTLQQLKSSVFPPEPEEEEPELKLVDDNADEFVEETFEAVEFPEADAPNQEAPEAQDAAETENQ